MRSSAILTSALVFTSACAAWPSDWNEVLAVAKLPFAKRVSTSYNLSYSATQGNTAATVTSTAAPTITGTATQSNSNADNSATITGSNSGSTATATDDNSNSNSTSATDTTPTQSTFDARLPPGGISMVTPNVYTTTFYKIKDEVTFAWNYTSCSILPTAIDILAVGAVTGVGVGAAPTFTLATNQSVSGSAGSYTWDTGEFQSTASTSLRTNYYTLVIHDAAKDVSAVASAGYLDTQATFTFGMYLPSPYTPFADWKCATCSGAMTAAERQTVMAVLGVAGVTVASFTWFAGVAGLW